MSVSPLRPIALVVAAALAISSCATPVPPTPATPFDVVEASIPEMKAAMRDGAVGQSYNPYDPRPNDDGTPLLDVSGSSSGGGVAANLWAANVGTSTGGSIEGPSNASMLVGIRPSTGRISR